MYRKMNDQLNDETLREKYLNKAREESEDAKAAMTKTTTPTKESKHPSVVAQRHMEDPGAYGQHRNDELAAETFKKLYEMLA